MTRQALEEIVRRVDPDLHRAALAADPESKSRLLPIYAFSCELANSAWTSFEPQVCAIRLKWWSNAVDGMERGEFEKSHALLESLAGQIKAANLPFAPFTRMVEAHFRCVNRERFNTLAEFEDHIDATHCEVMCLAAASLGTSGDAMETVRKFAWGAGAAAFLRAIPWYAGRGWAPLDREGKIAAEVVELARKRIRSARRHRRSVPKRAAPAMLAGWRVDATLSRAARNIERVRKGELEESEFRKRYALLWRGLTGIW